MPIVYIHGVATRNDDTLYAAELKRRLTFLERYIAPAIADDPEHVAIIPIYWGDFGAQFAWNRHSRPPTPLVGQGTTPEITPGEQVALRVELHDALAELPRRPAARVDTGGLTAAGVGPAAADNAPPLRLKDLTPAQLADLLVATIRLVAADPRDEALAAVAADTLAHDPATHSRLKKCANSREELAVLDALFVQYYGQEVSQDGGIVGMGTPVWLQRLQDRVAEALSRDADLSGFLLARAAVELLRKPLNEQVTLFVGDVLTYLAERGDAREPGPIPKLALAKLREAHENKLQRGGEPLIVLSHSMDGQIVYDLVTHFLPATPAYADIRIDFWCATASQVGLFEEMKRFKASSKLYAAATKLRAPFPDRRFLGGWWNVWDHNDVISFSVREIFSEEVDDEPYDSGMFIAAAHGGYLERPSFYRSFAAKLKAAQASGWNWRKP